MSLSDTLADIRRRNDWPLLAQAVPFARMLGLRVDVKGESFTCVLPYDHSLIGNPVLPALHGGAVGGFRRPSISASTTCCPAARRTLTRTSTW